MPITRSTRIDHGYQEVPVQAGEGDLADLAAERGLPEELLADVGIYAGKRGYHIPYPHLSGVWYERIKTYSGRPAKYLSPRGAEPHLYNPMQLGPNTDELWIAEGEFDTLVLVHLGLPAIGLPGVTTLVRIDTDTQEVRWKGEWRHLFSDVPLIVICTDNDDAGAQAAYALQREWPHALRLTDHEGRDLNDWWREDPDDLKAAIEEVRSE